MDLSDSFIKLKTRDSTGPIQTRIFFHVFAIPKTWNGSELGVSAP
jgi:hypothetical protein